MRAARIHGPEDIRVDDIEEPTVGPNEVKVKVAFNGICGTDLHEYYHGPRLVPVGRPHPVSGAMVPVVLGHEASGHVVELGDGVQHLALGDLVAIEPLQSCGSCDRCSSGLYNLCFASLFHGLNTGGGGLSELTVVPAAKALLVPAGVTALQAGLVEPLAVAYHAVRRAQVEAGKTAVVHGAGPIGIGSFLALRRAGIDAIVVEPSPARRAAVADLGAARVIDPTMSDVAAAIVDLTGGRRCRYLVGRRRRPRHVLDSACDDGTPRRPGGRRCGDGPLRAPRAFAVHVRGADHGEPRLLRRVPCRARRAGRRRVPVGWLDLDREARWASGRLRDAPRR